MDITDLLFVEIFAGSARLSKAAKQLGMQILPIDSSAARATQIYIAQYDLADPEQLDALLQVLEAEKQCTWHPHVAQRRRPEKRSF